ncbi:MAG: lactate racemase domain-containing protein [Thermodesulfobacteriota bacterium]
MQGSTQQNMTSHQKSVTVRVSLWKNERDIALSFPPEWEVVECKMAGHDLPPLTSAQIRKAFQNPIGTTPIRNIAVNKQKVVILFDDLTRPTPAGKMLPFIFEELAAAGVGDDKIRLVSAIGCHRPLSRHEMILKLGREVVEKYPVFNHNLFEHLVDLGKTRLETPVLVNREVAGCDFKIGLGCIIPHHTAGFGGGAKILLPGVSSIDTMTNHHVVLQKKFPDQVGHCLVDHNPVRLDMEEAARIAGLDVVVNVVLNHRKEVLGVFVGDFVKEHRAGVNFAKKVYQTENQGRYDILVVNAFPVEETPIKAAWPAKEFLKKDGDVVLIWQNLDGKVPHYLTGTFGSDYGGRKWRAPGNFRFSQAKRMFIYADELSKEERDWWGPQDRVFWYRDWDDLIRKLQSSYKRGTRVAVYPYATLQCPVLHSD